MSTERTFDRLASFDDRSRRFRIRGIVAGRPPRSYTWRHLQLDQGSEGACTGFAATMEAAARPRPEFSDPARFHLQTRYTVEGVTSTARLIYRRAKQLDEWPGENYDGSSVIAAVKAGMEQGWWAGYRWALGDPITVDGRTYTGSEAAAWDVCLAVSYHGPVIMGTYWYEAMMRPRSGDQLVVAGDVVGGHAYLLTRYDRRRHAVWTPNSWGGQTQGWISFDDLVTLLRNEGEACLVDRSRVAPVSTITP